MLQPPQLQLRIMLSEARPLLDVDVHPLIRILDAIQGSQRRLQLAAELQEVT